MRQQIAVFPPPQKMAWVRGYIGVNRWTGYICQARLCLRLVCRYAYICLEGSAGATALRWVWLSTPLLFCKISDLAACLVSGTLCALCSFMP